MFDDHFINSNFDSIIGLGGIALRQSNLHMAKRAEVQLSLATALPAYRPGETVTALLHASTSLPQDVELQEVEVLFTGIERVDTSWVSPSYRMDVPAINTDRRRVQRHIVLSKLQAATQGNFSDSNLRRFLFRHVCIVP